MGKTSAVTSQAGDVIGVGLMNLHVIVTENDGSWFAQGLEVDYAAQGASLETVKRHFEQGLAATIHEHLKIHGSIKEILVPAPSEVWQELLSLPATTEESYQEFTQVSVHKLPFRKIEYFVPKKAA